ncbi:MAG: DMT family transporter, partial [archaeon]|nr:DMT family transporter [archaeon]
MSTVDESTPEKKAGNDNDNININGKEKLSILLLIITTILWGTSFIITRTIIEVIPPMFYMGLRFFMAGIAFIPFIKQFKKISKEEIKISFVAGFLYFVAIGTQTLGMTDINTTASKAGFLTGLNVILVPIFLAIFFREKISKRIWIAVVLAIIGTYILSSNNGINSISIGDILIIICAIFCAFY